MLTGSQDASKKKNVTKTKVGGGGGADKLSGGAGGGGGRGGCLPPKLGTGVSVWDTRGGRREPLLEVDPDFHMCTPTHKVCQ